jgi:hypothetical protein
VSATSVRDSIGPTTEQLYKYVQQARQMVGQSQQTPLPIPEQSNEITGRIDSIIDRLESIESRMGETADAGRDAAPSISQQQIANISIAISQTLSADEEFKAALRGPKGERGPQGEQGPKGDQGPPGSADPEQLRQAVQDVLLSMSDEQVEQFARRLPPIYRQAIDGDTGKEIGEPTAVWLGQGYRYRLYRHQDVNN